MDMQLYARVLWRWKIVVVIGLLVAIGLTFLSIYKVPRNGQLTARKHSEYVSYATLFVTQKGFPSGRLGLTPVTTPGSTNTQAQAQTTPQASTAQIADLSRLTSLAIIYSHLATSDPVRVIMARSGPVKGTLQAAALPAAPGSSEDLPLISIAAITDTRHRRGHARSKRQLRARLLHRAAAGRQRRAGLRPCRDRPSEPPVPGEGLPAAVQDASGLRSSSPF